MKVIEAMKQREKDRFTLPLSVACVNLTTQHSFTLQTLSTQQPCSDVSHSCTHEIVPTSAFKPKLTELKWRALKRPWKWPKSLFHRAKIFCKNAERGQSCFVKSFSECCPIPLNNAPDWHCRIDFSSPQGRYIDLKRRQYQHLPKSCIGVSKHIYMSCHLHQYLLKVLLSSCILCDFGKWAGFNGYVQSQHLTSHPRLYLKLNASRLIMR